MMLVDAKRGHCLASRRCQCRRETRLDATLLFITTPKREFLYFKNLCTSHSYFQMLPPANILSLYVLVRIYARVHVCECVYLRGKCSITTYFYLLLDECVSKHISFLFFFIKKIIYYVTPFVLLIKIISFIFCFKVKRFIGIWCVEPIIKSQALC